MNSTELYPIPTSDDYLAAGFTAEQALQLQRLNLSVMERLLQTQEQISDMMNRLKPEAWL